MSDTNPRLPDPTQAPETVALPSLDGAVLKPSPDAVTCGLDGAPAVVSGPTVPGYEILSELGRGGMGVVYKARQKNPHRVVALKCILAGQLASPADVQRFRNEADAAAQMSHPGLIPIYEVGEFEGRHYFSMKLIEGGNLAEALAGGRWKTAGKEQHRAAARLVADAARAVHFAHQCGVIHRDLKPANILLGEGGQPLVTDFGLAKRFQGHDALTRSNVIMGTPAYMAPEQAVGTAGLTTAVDTYSLGAILYELVTGRPPFQGESPLSVVLQLREARPTPPRSLDRSIERDLETICLKCLEKDPGRRYGSAEALADDLERWLKGDVIQARRAGRLEWTWKWVRRHPARALLGVALCLVLGLALGSAGLFWRLGELEEERRKVALYAQEKDEAYAEALRGQDEARKSEALAQQARKQVEAALYSNGIARAHFEWLASDSARADQVLDECPESLRDWEWYYLKRLCRPDLLTIHAHDQPVYAVAVSRDGKLFATGSIDRTVKVWNALTGEEKITLVGHKSLVTGVAFSPDGKHLASSGGDRTPLIWDLETGKVAFKLEGHSDGARQVVYSADGKRLATAGWDMTVRLWDAETGTLSHTLKKHTKPVFSVAFSPDGSRLASASYDATVRIWELATGTDIQVLKGHTDGVASVVFSSDGKRVATGSLDKTAVVWDVESGQALRTYAGSARTVEAVAFSPDDRLLAAGSNDRIVRVWDVATGQERFSLAGHTSEVHSVAFTPDGGRLISASLDKTLKVWDVATHQESYVLAAGHDGPDRSPVAALAFSPVRAELASAEPSDRVIKVWDPATGREVFRLEGHRGGVDGLTYRGDGKRLASISAFGDGVKIWDMEQHREVGSLKPTVPVIARVAFSPDGSKLASASNDGTVKLWDAAAGNEVATLSGRTGRPVTCMAFSPDGKRLVTGSRDGTAKVWDMEHERLLRTYKGHNNNFVLALALSRDGKHVFSASSAGLVKVWNADTGETLLTLKGHAPRVDCLALSPDGNRLATGSGMDQAVTIWDAVTGHEILSLKGHTAAVRCLTFSLDGQLLASGSVDGAIRIWNATPLPPRLTPWLTGPAP
jgi:WD40 repeat protein/tRNA A-37 threonylcarbamoyl transferase component Bud32